MGGMAALTVEIWSDVVCPWCYVGKRRFEKALAAFEHRDEVEVVWRSFELDPYAAPTREGSSAEHLARKYGMSVEQAEDMNAQMTAAGGGRGARVPPRPHARRQQLPRPPPDPACRRAGQAGRDAGAALPRTSPRARRSASSRSLNRLAAELGLDPSGLEGNAYADAVRADEELAARIGIRGVPYFVLDRRYGVSGAQPSELLLQALEKAWEARVAAT